MSERFFYSWVGEEKQGKRKQREQWSGKRVKTKAYQISNEQRFKVWFNMNWICLSFVFVTISIYMLFQVSPTDVACCHKCSQHAVFGCQSGREVPKWNTMETVERNGIINSGWSTGGRWSRRREKTDTRKDRCNEKSTYEEKEKDKWVKKASKPKKPQWCCTALGRWGFPVFSCLICRGL